MIIPRNLHPTEHEAYEKVCFSHNGKIYFGQIKETEGSGIHKKYKIVSWINDLFFSVWVTASSILEDRRTHKEFHKPERRHA